MVFRVFIFIFIFFFCLEAALRPIRPISPHCYGNFFESATSESYYITAVLRFLLNNCETH